MALSLQTTLAAVLVLASLASAFDARFVNKTHYSPSLVHWNSSIDLIETKQANLSHVFAYPYRAAKLSLHLTRPFSTLSFKLKSRTSETVCNVTLEGLFTPKPTFKEKCSVATLSAQMSADPLFLHLDVSAHSDGFAIWDLVADETLHLSISQLSVRSYLPESGMPVETFIYQTSKTNLHASVYFSLLVDLDLPDGNDRCLTVASSLYEPQIETFYALEAWASSNRSVAVTRKDGAFCLRKELFAQGLGQVQVTFTVPNLGKQIFHLAGNVPSSILFTVVSFWAESDTFFGHVLNPEKKFEDSFRAAHPWLFYNREAFKYNVSSNSSKAVRICDMLANCYQMEEVVNGTMAKDGSKQYSVPEKVHSQLKYTPVVRVLTDDSKAKLETQYFSGQNETISRVLSHLTSEGIPAKLEYGFRLRFATKANISKPSSSHAPNIISLPMHLIDQRVQQFYVTINSTKSDLYLESIRLQFGPASSLNHTYLNLSLPIGDSKTFTTKDIFKPKIHALPSAGTQLTGLQIAYRAIGGKAVPEGGVVEVGVAIEVDTFDHHYESTTVFANFRPEVTFEVFAGGQEHHSSTLFDGQMSVTLTSANPTTLLLSNWIPANPVPDTDSWFSNQGHIRLAYRSVDGKAKLHQGDLRVKQIIWGFAEEDYVEEKELAHRENAGNYFYEEIRMQRKLLNDRYRLGYLISLADKGQVGAAGVTVDFEPNFQEITNALPSSPLCKGPTYGDVICRVEPYTCPEHYFKVNQDTGKCQMVAQSL